MGALIDSSILIAAERGQLDLDHLRTREAETSFALSVITASELLHGVHRGNTPKRRARREAFVEALLTSLPVMTFDLVAARTHARLGAALAAKGTPVGAHDLIIAATAISRGMDVVSRDERSFPIIPGLTFRRW